jgi:hypothetical protein
MPAAQAATLSLLTRVSTLIRFRCAAARGKGALAPRQTALV